MSVSGSREMGTVNAVLSPNTSSTEAVSVDATEDRRIVGYEISVVASGADSQTSHRTRIAAGSLNGLGPPGAGSADIDDKGDQFHVEHEGRAEFDGTNQYGHQHGMQTIAVSGLDYEWNEDVTLNIEATETKGLSAPLVRVQVRYVEV